MIWNMSGFSYHIEYEKPVNPFEIGFPWWVAVKLGKNKVKLGTFMLSVLEFAHTISS